MSAARDVPMSLGDFLRWEESEESRFEFDGFGPVAMAGGTAAHAAIQRNLLIALGVPLRGRPCQPFGSELKIEVAGSIRYPDAFVVGTPIAATAKVVVNPIVVFEILSESSANDDLVVKNAEYRASPSIQRYVVLQQARVGAAVFTRKGDDWVLEFLNQQSVLRMPEIGIEFALDDVYLGLDFGRPNGSA